MPQPTWSENRQSPFPALGGNQRPSLIRLANGHWLLVYNDAARGRNSLAVSLSEDEGKTWPWKRHLEKQDKGSFHYPAVIQGRSGRIHIVYSYFVEGGKSMKHAAFDANWVRQGENQPGKSH